MEEKKNNAIEKVENVIRRKKKKKKEGDEGEGVSEKDAERETKPKSSKKGLIAATVALAITTAVLATAFTVTVLTPNVKGETLENSYRLTFYDAITRVDDIDLNISKVMASKDDGAKQEYLIDLAVNSEAVENDLSSLPLEDESRFYTVKLINQIGDFAKYANKKLIRGENLSEKDYEILGNLYRANKNLKNSLKDVADSADGITFSDVKTQTGGIFIDEMEMLENLSVEFPELIYDGPFSDGQDDVSVKGLSGAEISETESRAVFTELFSDMKYTDYAEEGETAAGIKCYNSSAKVKGDYLYAQISKTGGKLISFAYSGSCKSVKIDQSAAIGNALAFAEKAGVTGLKAVWVNLANNLYTINFAFDLGGIIVYSDLVKIRVCAETGMVIGYDAESYYYNHTEREIPSPTLTVSECRDKVSDEIEIASERLCIVPIGNDAEKLCYEFAGEYDGATFYVYIDTKTGRQVNMFKVVKGTEGDLLT